MAAVIRILNAVFLTLARLFLIAWIGGSHSGVVGLPVYETRALLLAAGYALG